MPQINVGDYVTVMGDMDEPLSRERWGWGTVRALHSYRDAAQIHCDRLPGINSHGVGGDWYCVPELLEPRPRGQEAGTVYGNINRGDLVYWDVHGREMSGTVMHTSVRGTDQHCRILLSPESRRLRWPWYAPSRRPRTDVAPRDSLYKRAPRSIYEPPMRYGPYRPVAKALP